jgi:hypothetical protein
MNTLFLCVFCVCRDMYDAADGSYDCDDDSDDVDSFRAAFTLSGFYTYDTCMVTEHRYARPGR